MKVPSQWDLVADEIWGAREQAGVGGEGCLPGPWDPLGVLLWEIEQEEKQNGGGMARG